MARKHFTCKHLGEIRFDSPTDSFGFDPINSSQKICPYYPYLLPLEEGRPKGQQTPTREGSLVTLEVKDIPEHRALPWKFLDEISLLQVCRCCTCSAQFVPAAAIEPAIASCFAKRESVASLASSPQTPVLSLPLSTSR